MTNKKAIALVLGVMCFALTSGICIQVKTVKNTSSTSSKNYEENNLRAEVLKYKEKYDNLLKETEKVDSQLQEQIESATKNNSELEEAKNQINDGNKMIGLTEVTGPGIILTIADSDIDSSSVLDPSNFIIHDIDLLKVVNELKNAGAEAISINNQRIILTTPIICGGNIININGEKTSYMPGWFKDGDNWRYILKNGYYAQNGWLQDPATQKYYYFNMAAIMEADTTTPDGYYVGADGAWDGNASTKNTTEEKNLGPGVDKGWEPVDTGWKFKQEDGTYLTNSWRQDSNGKWYYLNEDGWMLKDTNTSDGYHVGADGVYDGPAVTEETAE